MPSRNTLFVARDGPVLEREVEFAANDTNHDTLGRQSAQRSEPNPWLQGKELLAETANTIMRLIHSWLDNVSGLVRCFWRNFTWRNSPYRSW